MKIKKGELKTLWTFAKFIIKPFKLFIAGEILVSLILAIFLLLKPYIIKLTLNKIPEVIASEQYSIIILLVLLYLLSDLLTELTFIMHDWLIFRYVPLIKRNTIKAFMQKVILYPASFYQSHNSGGIANKSADIAVGLPKLVQALLEHFFKVFLIITFSIVMVWSVNYKFGLLTLGWVLFFIAVVIYFFTESKFHMKSVASARAVLISQVVDVLTNISSVRLFSNRNWEMLRCDGIIGNAVNAERARNKFNIKFNAYRGLSFVVFQGFSLYFLISGLRNGTVSTGDFPLILSLNFSIISSLWEATRELDKLTEHLGNILNAIDIYYFPINPNLLSDSGNRLVVSNGKIVFDSVNFSYNLNLKDNLNMAFFQNFSLTINSGQRVGLVGYSGSGKSTFVNLLLRLFEINSGNIYIDGQDIGLVNVDSLRANIAVISQETILFNRTIYENIAYGNLLANKDEVMGASMMAHTHEFIIKLADGYDTIVGDRGSSLSGGQRQRIVIARAILKKASILVLDEATSQLDSVTEGLIQDSLLTIMRDKTVIVVAHRLSTLLHMDRILVFDSGRIVQDGTHDKLLNSPGLYADLWKAQVHGFLPDELV